MTEKKLTCPACGSEYGIYGRADIRWQPLTQSWEIGDMEDTLDCTECDAMFSLQDSAFPRYEG